MKRLLFVISLSAIFYACPSSYNDPDCSRFWYDFDIPVTFEPADSVLHIGDTITITSQFPNKLFDHDSTDTFVFDSINFYTACGINKIDTFNNSKANFSTFDLFNIIVDKEKYNYKKGNISFSIDYVYDGERYLLQFKIVPKYKGVYYFTFFSLLNVRLDLKSEEIYSEKTGCTTEHWHPGISVNNGIGNNKEFLKLSPLKSFNTTVYNDWYKNNYIHGTHMFKVE